MTSSSTFKKRNPFRLILAGILLATSAFAFDWPEKTNSQVRADMIAFASSLRDQTSNSIFRTELSQFVSNIESATNKPSDRYQWMNETHSWVREKLAEYKPSLANAEIRKGIFRILDYPLHVNNYAPAISREELDAFNLSIQNYILSARTTTLDDIEKTKPTSGIVIWEIYNMGYIIRSPQHTIALDITGNPPTFVPSATNPPLNRVYSSAFTDADFDRLVAQIDVLFVTHLHGDHFSPKLSQKILDAGKILVLPEEAQQYNPLTRKTKKHFKTNKNLIILNKTNIEPTDIAGVKVRNFRGNQGEDTPCNIYHIDLDGIVIIDNGDNYDRDQERNLSSCPPANIIIASCWNDMPSFVGNAAKAPNFKKANPLLIPAHENELGHGVGHRESYRELFTREDRLAHKTFVYPPVMLLNCGERLNYPLPTESP